jgi:hypothetical protein
MMATYPAAPNLSVTGANGVQHAYREAGEGAIPLVLLQHFRGNLDNSYLLAGLIAGARAKIYPDSAHGFLLQHHAEFARDVEAFLGEAAAQGDRGRPSTPAAQR